jgi:hypothetical protein
MLVVTRRPHGSWPIICGPDLVVHTTPQPLDVGCRHTCVLLSTTLSLHRLQRQLEELWVRVSDNSCIHNRCSLAHLDGTTTCGAASLILKPRTSGSTHPHPSLRPQPTIVHWYATLTTPIYMLYQTLHMMLLYSRSPATCCYIVNRATCCYSRSPAARCCSCNSVT